MKRYRSRRSRGRPRRSRTRTFYTVPRGGIRM